MHTCKNCGRTNLTRINSVVICPECSHVTKIKTTPLQKASTPMLQVVYYALFIFVSLSTHLESHFKAINNTLLFILIIVIGIVISISIHKAISLITYVTPIDIHDYAFCHQCGRSKFYKIKHQEPNLSATCYACSTKSQLPSTEDDKTKQLFLILRRKYQGKMVLYGQFSVFMLTLVNSTTRELAMALVISKVVIYSASMSLIISQIRIQNKINKELKEQ